MDGSFSLLDLFIIILRRKRTLVFHFLAVTAASLALAFFIPKKYKSTTLFLPPMEEATTMSPLSLGFSLNLGNQVAFSAQQIETLLDSRAILEQIIRKFDLMKVYKTEKAPNNLEKALKILRHNIKLNSVTQNNFASETVVHYELSVIDKDRQRSADIVNEMVNLLNQTMENLSHNQESYVVAFIKSRLDSVEVAKDTVQRRMAEFQKEHKIYAPDMKEQVLASVSTFAELKKEKIMTQIERDLLLVDRQSHNQEVVLAERRLRELDREMKNLESKSGADVLPGLNSSVDISYQYLAMVKENEVQMKLELLLRQQYEEARIKNAKRAPVVRVVDPAVPPQWKNSPKKSLVVLVCVGLYMPFLLAYILLRHGVERLGPDGSRKMAEFKRALGWKKV